MKEKERGREKEREIDRERKRKLIRARLSSMQGLVSSVVETAFVHWA